MSLAPHCNSDISISKSDSACERYSGLTIRKILKEFGKYPKAGPAETRWRQVAILNIMRSLQLAARDKQNDSKNLKYESFLS